MQVQLRRRQRAAQQAAVQAAAEVAQPPAAKAEFWVVAAAQRAADVAHRHSQQVRREAVRQYPEDGRGDGAGLPW